MTTAFLDAIAEDRQLDATGKVHVVATHLIVTEGGPLAEQLLAMPSGDVLGRRELLRASVAWPWAERLLGYRD